MHKQTLNIKVLGLKIVLALESGSYRIKINLLKLEYSVYHTFATKIVIVFIIVVVHVHV